MAYNKFKKIAELETKFGLQESVKVWLPIKFNDIIVSDYLKQALIEAKEAHLGTEKAKSEYIIVPILKELQRNNKNSFTCFSGYELNVDKESGLTGYCDFILSAETNKSEISAPIICLVEAKNGEIEKGLAQCVAEMYASQLFNKHKNKPLYPIYGIVTNAFSWCFLQLKDKNILIDPDYVPFTFANPKPVLSVLQWILDESLKQKNDKNYVL